MKKFLRHWWREIYGLYCQRQGWFAFTLWLVWHCLCRRKAAVIICRCGAMGDVVCALPLCEAARRQHPNCLIVFVTAAVYRNLVALSGAMDLVYGSQRWNWPYVMPAGFRIPGLVKAIYNPRTTDEINPQAGATRHLVDDLARSCGLSVVNRQPRLFPPPDRSGFIRKKYGLAAEKIGQRLLIGINAGRTWPVRTWEAEKWRQLIGKIHAQYDAVVIQFGLTSKNGPDEFDKLDGVVCLNNILQTEEIAVLVADCDLIVAIDSGPLHIAGAVGTPVIGLFGPVNPQFRLPPGSPGTGLHSEVPCLFCHNQTPLGHWVTGCPHDIQCMKLLEVETVFQAVQQMLNTSAQPRRYSPASV